MSDIQEIYQQVVLDHNKSPRNFRKMEHPDKTAQGYNPLCGDQLCVYVTLDNDTIADVSFLGKGCAICMASASIMTESLKGKTNGDAEALFDRFHKLLTEDSVAIDLDGEPKLGKLKAFAGVREFPVRVKCATLPWHTFHAALHNSSDAVTTE